MTTVQYINVKAVHRLIGDSYPFGIPRLVKLLERFCHHLEKDVDPWVASIPKRLLQHNLGKRRIEISEMAKIDADIRINLNRQAKEEDIALLNFAKEGMPRPPGMHRVVLHIHMVEKDGMQRTISVPFQPLIVGWGDVEAGYQGYSHSIAFFSEDSEMNEERYYVGISSRNWLKRMSEHMAEIRSGSNKLFHRQWREYQGNRDVMFNSELVVLNHTYEGIMGWEEVIVKQYMDEGLSLNMIPGGFEGMKFLYQHRLTTSPRVSLEERDRAVDAYILTHPRAGVPNLLVSKAWQDDEYYEKVITGRDNTLTSEQVRLIRALASEGLSVEEILTKSGARNLGQVRRVLDGTSYARIQ